MNKILESVKNAVLLTLVLMLICGIGYPLLMTGIGKVLFPYQANGSIIEVEGAAVGSHIVGQDFTDPRFMKCRPSAVSYNTYTAEEKANGTYGGVASGSNNYSATNPALIERIARDMDIFLAANPSVKKQDIPTDLLTASGSGLDPHISPAAARVQIPALAVSTGLSGQELESIIKTNTTGKVLGIFGEETVNVLGVNLDIAQKIGCLG